MYSIYGLPFTMNMYPLNVRIYTIHGSYGYCYTHDHFGKYAMSIPGSNCLLSAMARGILWRRGDRFAKSVPRPGFVHLVNIPR